MLGLSDGEGLYTLADGLKPISSGISISVTVAPQLDEDKLALMEQLRRAAAALTCGEVGAFLHVFTDVFVSEKQGTVRSAEVVVFHRAAVAAAVARHAEYFGRLGITPAADPREVLAAVENASRVERWRGYGYLYGYPDEAVEFFATAGLAGDAAKQVVPREFRRIETWKKFPEKQAPPPHPGRFLGCRRAVAREARAIDPVIRRAG